MFCMMSHAAASKSFYGDDATIVDDVLKDMHQANISNKMKALLHIAGKVQILGREVTQQDVDAARNEGATDKEIHDTVLIAAAFCMFNRYVDGLGTWAPPDRQLYVERAVWRADEGYADIDLYK
jgi:uncharacterized peroxidase-related enzyme